jgi:hypothetical protein
VRYRGIARNAQRLYVALSAAPIAVEAGDVVSVISALNRQRDV